MGRKRTRISALISMEWLGVNWDRGSLLIAIFLLSSFHSFSQVQVSGVVRDHKNTPIPFAQVFLKKADKGAVANVDGEFVIWAQEGVNDLIFNAMGYRRKVVQVIVRSEDQKLDVWMDVNQKELDEIVVKANKRDPAYGIIREAIRSRSKNRSQIESSTCNVYIKATELEIDKKDRQKQKNRDSTDVNKVDSIETIKDSVRDVNLVEIKTFRVFNAPNDYKEIREGYKKVGVSRYLYYLNTSEEQYDFYANFIRANRLAEIPIISPLHMTSFLSYKFKLERIYFLDTLMVYHIKLTSRNKGNNTFTSGYIDIIEGSFAINKVEVEIDGGSLRTYDEFKLNQEYTRVEDSIWIVSGQTFDYLTKVGKTKYKGQTKVLYSDFKFNVDFPKRYFKNELSVTTQEAYDKDSTFWNESRPVELTPEERRAIFRDDSIRVAHSAESYLDSIDSVDNRINYKKILWAGVTNYNRKKDRRFYFMPILGMWDPFSFGGVRFQPSMEVEKKYENGRKIIVDLEPSYGLENNDLKGSIGVSYKFIPRHFGTVSASVVHNFLYVSEPVSVINAFEPTNFVERTQFTLGGKYELLNGLYLSEDVALANNASVEKYKAGYFSSNIAPESEARSFASYRTLRFATKLKFTPNQKYMIDRNEKIVLGSRWPTFTLEYKKSVPGILNSILNYDFLSLNVLQKMNVGQFGISIFELETGQFLNTRSVRYEDKMVFGRSDFWFFSSPYENQMQESTFVTTKPYAEAHYTHYFKGTLLQNLPLLRRLKFETFGGMNYLFIKEANYHYADIYYGICRPFKIGRTKIKPGLHVVYGGSSRQFNTPTLQFGIVTEDE